MNDARRTVIVTTRSHSRFSRLRIVVYPEYAEQPAYDATA